MVSIGYYQNKKYALIASKGLFYWAYGFFQLFFARQDPEGITELMAWNNYCISR